MTDFEKYTFGKRLLESQGWTSGKGLGRNEAGIAEALKPSLKFDKAGVGHNKADDLCFNWWDHVYKKAASNIVVENLEDGVEMKQIEDNSDLITTKKWKLKKKKKKNRKQSSLPENKPLKYGIFMKSSVLTNHGEIKDETSQPYSDDDGGQDGDDDDDEFPHRADLDETLLKACEGRTAHKGARHGLTASGKLMRLEAQENGVDVINLAVSEKKKRKVHDDEETSTIPNGEDVGREELLPERKRAKKKKKKMNRSQSRNKLESEISQNVGNGDRIGECGHSEVREDTMNEVLENQDDHINTTSENVRKKKKKKQKRISSDDIV